MGPFSRCFKNRKCIRKHFLARFVAVWKRPPINGGWAVYLWKRRSNNLLMLTNISRCKRETQFTFTVWGIFKILWFSALFFLNNVLKRYSKICFNVFPLLKMVLITLCRIWNLFVQVTPHDRPPPRAVIGHSG